MQENHGLCNTCAKIVPARTAVRDGAVYLIKKCPECGVTETLISTHAKRYQDKFSLDHVAPTAKKCALNCLKCAHPKNPDVVFMDITNRCNMNCPICITNVPKMKFLFEPGMEYFHKVFKYLSELNPKPTVQMFGGEPTVREDLLQIVRLARKTYGLNVRVATNGIKLADKEYVRQLLDKKARVMLSYDGGDPEMYRKIRGSAKWLDIKRQALQNVWEVGGQRITILTLVAKDYNANKLQDLLTFLHEKRSCLKQIYFLPLAHTWEKCDWDYDPEPMTTEDVEEVVANSFPGENIQFWPAGMWGQMPAMLRCFDVKFVPFRGAHPGCESMYILMSDGQKYVPMAHYVKTSTNDVAQALLEMEKGLAKKVEALDNGWWGRLLGRVGLKEKYLFLLGVRSMVSALKPHVYLGRLIKGKGLAKVGHTFMAALEVLARRHMDNIRVRHTTIQDSLVLLMLPVDDRYCVETDRLKRCAAAWAVIDPDDDQVKTFPFCAWNVQPRHKEEIMRRLAARYNKDKADGVAQTVAQGRPAEALSTAAVAGARS